MCTIRLRNTQYQNKRKIKQLLLVALEHTHCFLQCYLLSCSIVCSIGYTGAELDVSIATTADSVSHFLAQSSVLLSMSCNTFSSCSGCFLTSAAAVLAALAAVDTVVEYTQAAYARVSSAVLDALESKQ
jgi:hypothetical protein